MRILMLSLVVIGGLAGAAAGPAAADAPMVQPLPDAACNGGTMNARGSVPAQASGHVPMVMGGMCVTMPATHP